MKHLMHNFLILRGNMIKVKIIYRNYRPIHSIFQSIMISPPDGVKYYINPVKKRPSFLFNIYRHFGDNKLVHYIIHKYQKYIFKQDVEPGLDLLHVVDMVLSPKARSRLPYIVDVGHVGALANHTGINDSIMKDIISYLLHDNCKSIIARSEASAQSILAITSGEIKKRISRKIKIIYPVCIPLMSKKDIWSIKKTELKSKDLRLLFIGNDARRKGLGELLEAYVRLRKQKRNISLTVISNGFEDVTSRYPDEELQGVVCHKARFTIQQLTKDFYLKSHLFVMPSHQEILGVVFLEALSLATPVIAIDQYSTPELVKNSYNGYLIKSHNIIFSKDNPLCKDFGQSNLFEPEEIVIGQLVTRINTILDSRELLVKLSKNALDSIYSNPCFNVQNRNKILKEIYDKALI